MTWYVYKMEGSSGHSFRSGDDPAVAAYIAKHGADKQCLWLPMPHWANLIEAEFDNLRRWSSSGFLKRDVCRRAIANRDWSKK